jgi:hypothetical protein
MPFGNLFFWVMLFFIHASYLVGCVSVGSSYKTQRIGFNFSQGPSLKINKEINKKSRLQVIYESASNAYMFKGQLKNVIPFPRKLFWPVI